MGKITIRSRDDLSKKIKTLKDAEEWSEVIKYSPCGKLLAVGSHDNMIFIYDVENNYSLYYKCAKHNSFVTSLDWSLDSTYIRSVCGAYDKLFFNIKAREFDSHGANNTQSYKWASQSCKVGTDVAGIYPSGEDGSHINGVNMSVDENLLATSDDFGLVNIFRYPCLN